MQSPRWMCRQSQRQQSGALVAPARSALLGALAVTALGSLGLKLLHAHDTSVLVLAWLLASLATTAGLVQVLARIALPRLSR